MLCFVLFSLVVGKLFAHTSLLPGKEKEENKAENLTWKHQEELLPACVAGRREGAVCTSHKGERLGAPLRLSDLKKKIHDPGLFVSVPVTWQNPIYPFKLFFLGLFHFKLMSSPNSQSKASKLALLT